MTQFVPGPEFKAFSETHTIEGVKPVAGGYEVRYYTPFVYTPEQQAFDQWENSHPPRFTSDYLFWPKRDKKPREKKSGQAELGL
jgi:hypothetical protein